MSDVTSAEVVSFWREAGPERWFGKDDGFDLRNMFRGSARAFATDALARVVANRALARGFDQATDEMMRPFFYLALMHSELLADQDRCVRLHEAFADPELLKYATLHRDIVVKFGRFPHRNRAMGRDTTPAEQEFLGGGGFAG